MLPGTIFRLVQVGNIQQDVRLQHGQRVFVPFVAKSCIAFIFYGFGGCGKMIDAQRDPVACEQIAVSLEILHQLTIILVVKMQFGTRRSRIQQDNGRSLSIDHAFVSRYNTPFQLCLKTRASVKRTEKALLLSLFRLIVILYLHDRVLPLIICSHCKCTRRTYFRQGTEDDWLIPRCLTHRPMAGGRQWSRRVYSNDTIYWETMLSLYESSQIVRKKEYAFFPDFCEGERKISDFSFTFTKIGKKGIYPF